MPDFSKSPGSRVNKVRQIKGPGMNKGLPKRHKIAKPKALKGSGFGAKTFGASGGKGPSGQRTSNTSSNSLTPGMQFLGVHGDGGKSVGPLGMRRKTWSGKREFPKKKSGKVL